MGRRAQSAGLERVRRAGALEEQLTAGRRGKGATLQDHGEFGEMVATTVEAWRQMDDHEGKGFHWHQLMRAVSFALDVLFSPGRINYSRCRELDELFSTSPTEMYTYAWTKEKQPLALALFSELVRRGDLHHSKLRA